MSTKEDEWMKLWKEEEARAHIHGWDFTHIVNRYTEEYDLPWDYKEVIDSYRKPEHQLLDIDTGGGEFLLSLKHPVQNTSATEGYAPNVQLCIETLLPLGIHFKEATNFRKLPFDNESFDLVINRHGDFDCKEVYRLLKPGGYFITQQVGEDNDRELVDFLLPGTKKPFPGMNLSTQSQNMKDAGFTMLMGEEAFRPIKFYDVGALVWFAKIISWEFPNFSVDACLHQLLKAQETVDQYGFIGGRIHRYLMVGRK